MSTTDWLAGALIGVLALAALVAHLAAAWPEPEPCDHACCRSFPDGHLHPLLLRVRRNRATDMRKSHCMAQFQVDDKLHDHRKARDARRPRWVFGYSPGHGLPTI